MPEMTLSQAAKWAGVTRPTIHKAITGGRLSAKKDDNGQWQIDPAELERVYTAHKPVDMSGNTKLFSPDIADLTAAKEREIGLLREMLDEVRRERDDVRQDRDHWREQAESQTRLLTHQGQPSASQASPRKQGWFARLRGAA